MLPRRRCCAVPGTWYKDRYYRYCYRHTPRTVLRAVPAVHGRSYFRGCYAERATRIAEDGNRKFKHGVQIQAVTRVRRMQSEEPNWALRIVGLGKKDRLKAPAQERQGSGSQRRGSKNNYNAPKKNKHKRLMYTRDDTTR